MWRWYKNSSVCIVYLHDVSERNSNVSKLEQSDWFTRGWTLQELLAPQGVIDFYSKEYDFLGTRADLAERIAEITNIASYHLESGLGFLAPHPFVSVAER